MSDLRSDLDRLARDILADAALIPLQRRIRNARIEITRILATGVTVRALATELAARGVTGKVGPLSYGHLRVLLARMDQKAVDTEQPSTSPPPISVPNAPPRAAPSARPDFSAGLFRQDELD